MRSYLFTLFVRFFVSISGVIIFLVTSKIFGASGRGLISYGSALASIFGLLYSLNLGRSFLFETKKNEELKRSTLSNLLYCNYLLILASVISAIAFWHFNSNAKEILDFNLLMYFLLLIPFYLWAVNGNIFFASFNITKKQDLIILTSRILLIFLALITYKFNFVDIKTFLFFYSAILACSVVAEIIALRKEVNGNFRITLKYFINLTSKSSLIHVDFLTINIFSLVLTLIAASKMSLPELGNFNFTIQILNFIYILAIVASLKIKTYVSYLGIIQNYTAVKKLLTFTLLVSFLFVLIIFFSLDSNYFKTNFVTFDKASFYFFVACFSIPGFIAYQFIHPGVLEFDLVKLAAKGHSFIFIFCAIFSYPLISHFKTLGAILAYTIFHLFILFFEIYLFKKIHRMKQI